LLKGEPGYQWITGICALLAGLAPAIYKALDFDVSLNVVAQHAHQLKILQDRFRQARSVTALASFEDLRKEFDDLMKRMDAARTASLTPPERFFKKAQTKIQSGDYSFEVDLRDKSTL
jgi:DnaJ-domain-containing protein 1